MQYSAQLLAHFFNPKNVGTFLETDQLIAETVTGSYSNGVLVQLQLKIVEDRIMAAKFRAYGNVSTIAACSFATEWLKNKRVNEAEQFSYSVLVEELKIPEKKIHSALLIEDAVKKTIKEYYKVCA